MKDVKLDTRVSRRVVAKGGAAVAGAVVATGTLGKAILAQEATPAEGGEGGPGLPPLPEGATVVAQGLYNPRDIYYAEDGTLYITEVGVGGDEVLTGPAPGEGEGEATPAAEGEEATPAEDAGPPSTRGYTGQISMVLADGTQQVLVTGLASYSDLVGPSGVTMAGGDLYFTVGGAAPSIGLERLDGEGWVGRVAAETSELEWVADIGAYEVENNPDGTDVNPNLYDIAVLNDGTLYVNDAGGNVTYSVDPATGDFAPVVVYPLQGELPEASADPTAAERQVVPTGLAVADDGTVFVNFLGEGWPADAPSILVVNADGSLGVVARGLNAVVDITWGPDDNIYATVLTTDFENFGPGQILRVNPADGTSEVVVDGVFMPHGISFDPDGNLYIAVFTMLSGPDAPAGQVIRMDGVAAPTA